MNVLVTGGAGYIGSHTVLKLQEAGHTPVVYDNLSNGRMEFVFSEHFIAGDINDRDRLKKTISDYGIEAVLHFAAFIEAGESMLKPDKYFSNNSNGTICLLNTLVETGVNYFVFSSTAALYGYPDKIPIEEDSTLIPANPYGESKLIVERVLKWYSEIHKLRYVSLRYFNAAGSDEKMRCGEVHIPETHLIPLAIKAAFKERGSLSIYGTDYGTKDGTCIRDYIHVEDLADAHLLALDYLVNEEKSDIFNLGCQRGYSVREVIDVVKSATARDFYVNEDSRRRGDPEELIASSEKIRRILGWKPKKTDMKEIVASAVNFYRKWNRMD